MLPSRTHRLLAEGLLVLLTAAAYLPVACNSYIWDDNYYVTENQTLRNFDGLRRIWCELGAVPQYYPLTHTTFWVEYHLWGLNPLGYHIVNVLLHALVAVLWSRLLLLRIGLAWPAAWLAAAVFALHPVHVESVAWITERKNVLCGVFYLLSAICYLDAREKESWLGRYALSLLFFIAALLSKTVASTLPCALLLVVWMMHGRWTRRDLLTIPYFILGVGMGMLTLHMERTIVGAEGAEWNLTILERILVAGRALWFYATKLAWPQPLIFIYPRWHIDAHAFGQYLYPAAALAVIAALWAMRKQIGRGPLAGVLFFAGTLVPALGFFNVFPFRYSYVADHFQYLASMGLIALAAVCAEKTVRPYLGRVVGGLVAGTLLCVLGTLTALQLPMYRDLETLWRQTIERNPQAWMACNNLGTLLDKRGEYSAAIASYEQSLKIKPDHVDARYNLALSLASLGRYEDAIEQYKQVLKLAPLHVGTLNSMGHALMQLQRDEEAAAAYQKSLRARPRNRADVVEALNNLGIILRRQGRLDAAQQAIARALEVDPGDFQLHKFMGSILQEKGQREEAEASYRQAIALNPKFADAHGDLGMLLAERGEMSEAVRELTEAARLEPTDAGTWSNLGSAQLAAGDPAAAVASFKHALSIEPDRIGTLRRLAWVLATHPNAPVRNGPEALTLAERAATLTRRRDPLVLDTLAAAAAETGDFAEAIATVKEGLMLARDAGRSELAEAMSRRQALYEAGRPYRDRMR